MLELFSYLLGMPNDVHMLLTQILSDRSSLSQENCTSSLLVNARC